MTIRMLENYGRVPTRGTLRSDVLRAGLGAHFRGVCTDAPCRIPSVLSESHVTRKRKRLSLFTWTVILTLAIW